MTTQLKVYTYKNCSTCKKATTFLKANNIAFNEIPIRETPPSLPELRQMADRYEGNLKKIINVSGQDYRNLGLKDKLADMSDADVIALLASNGNLVKRPFAISESFKMVGFKPDEWSALA